MNFLVVGLGSMGRRRIRCLKSLGFTNIFGFDVNPKRCEQAVQEYGISIIDNPLLNDLDKNIHAWLICTPPDCHMKYAFKATRLNCDSFIEASVTDIDGIKDLAKLVEQAGTVTVPSCTMMYFRGPQIIKELVSKKIVGKPFYFSFHRGEFLENWHPWEKIQEFYVSKRETGGCREIVPFELTWINDIFGIPEPISCFKDKLSEMQADIDDIYVCCLKYPDNIVGNVLIEVLAKPEDIRTFTLVGSNGRLEWLGREKVVRFIVDGDKDWQTIKYDDGKPHQNYIYSEQPYIDEIKDFVAACNKKDASLFPNTLSLDVGVLELLKKLEMKSGVNE